MNPNLQSKRRESIIRKIRAHYQLILELTKRDISNKYQGTSFGSLWPLITPLLMLSIYTFIFGAVFKSRWPQSTETGTAIFAITLFCGLLFHNMLAECLARAPTTITGNPNYVKKVVFPLEILPLVSTLSTAFNFLMGLLMWCAFHLIFKGPPPASIIQAPLITIPLILYCIAISWAISALSVYLRDIAQVTSFLSTALLFLSPVFFSVESTPQAFQIYMQANPMTFIIESARNTMMWGINLDFAMLALHTIIGLALCMLSLRLFEKLRPGFSDVL